MTGTVGLITARGGSKGIPRKNIRPLAGKPLIAWTIQAAQESTALARVIVSTDDAEIAEVAREWGAEVPFLRPAELAQDDSPHHDVVLHALNWFESQSVLPEYLLLLQPTSPLRTAEDIDAAIALALENEADAVVSVCVAHNHPYLSKQIAADGRLSDFMARPGGYLSRQALPPIYSPNGAIYLARPRVLLERGDWYTENTYAYLMPAERSLDIDSSWDWHLTELILRDAQHPTPD